MNGFGSTNALAETVSVALICVEAILALIALILLAKKHALGQYKSLAAILIFIFSGNVVGSPITHLHPTNRHLLSEIYFYSFWSGWIVEAILMPIFCYGILTRLFSSLPELRSISTRVFGWIVFLWCAVSASFFFMPHMNAMHLMVAEATQLKRLEGGISLLTAMVVFVCIRPLGLQLRSPLPAFGLGLIFSAMIIFSSGFGRTDPQRYIWIMIFGSVAICAQLISWVAAISWSEPARQTVSV
jgi:hypothetical protein